MIDYQHGTWTIGAYAFWTATALAALIFAITCVLTVSFLTRDKTRAQRRATGSVFTAGTLVAAVIFGLAALGYFPFGSGYHHWYPVTGTVDTTSSRLIHDGDHGMSQRYVVRFTQSSTLYGCDDTRCAAATHGDHLTLSCRREWQFQATPGWTCRYHQTN